jgi:hypothetical protein
VPAPEAPEAPEAPAEPAHHHGKWEFDDAEVMEALQAADTMTQVS